MFKTWFGHEHVGCKDTYCLTKIEDVEDWDRLFFADMDTSNLPEGYSPCCGICGCCPCGSIRCSWCRYDIWPFSWWSKLSWKLWGKRQWAKFERSFNRDA